MFNFLKSRELIYPKIDDCIAWDTGWEVGGTTKATVIDIHKKTKRIQVRFDDDSEMVVTLDHYNAHLEPQNE